MTVSLEHLLGHKWDHINDIYSFSSCCFHMIYACAFCIGEKFEKWCFWKIDLLGNEVKEGMWYQHMGRESESVFATCKLYILLLSLLKGSWQFNTSFFEIRNKDSKSLFSTKYLSVQSVVCCYYWKNGIIVLVISIIKNEPCLCLFFQFLLISRFSL